MKTLKIVLVIILSVSMFYCDDSNEENVVSNKKSSLPEIVEPPDPDPETYSILYHGNNYTSGTIPIDSNEYESDEEIIVLGNDNIIKIDNITTAYYFDCWNELSDGTGTDYYEGNSIYITEDKTLYAKWTAYELQDIGPAGGHIFHDKGSYSDGWRYLESAPESTEWIAQWGSYSYLIEETSKEIGSGKDNTDLIVEWLDDNEDDTYGDVTDKVDRAAYLCYNLVYNDYNDWFLPSENELIQMYEILHAYDIGGFSDTDYWASYELELPSDGTVFSRVTNFNNNGLPWGASKISERNLRAIRSF